MSDLEKQASQEPVVVEDTLKYPSQPWYLKVPFLHTKTDRKPVGEHEKQMTPEASAGFFSLLTFSWMTPILLTGYARPLENSDLYRLQDHRSSAHIGRLIVESFERRRKAADEYNTRLVNGEVKAGWRRAIIWTLRGNREERERHWRTVGGQKSPSLVLALNDSVRWWFWSAGALRLISDSLTITSPLLVQAIINFVSDSYNARSQGTSAPPLWKGVVMGLGLFLMQLTASICQHHFWYRASSTGVLVRGGLIAALYSRSFSLSPRARVTLPNGQMVTHIASDVSRIDMGANLAHTAWSTSMQIIIALIILLVNLGPSALAGFSLFLFGMPVQSWILKLAYKTRSNSMKFTDTRVKLIQELLSGIRVIKFFAWEIPFLKRLVEIRKKEMKYVRKLLLIRSGNTAVATSFPILATVLTFICYSLTGHSLEPGIIFTSLTLFQLLRSPVMLLPVALGSVTDAYNAVSRIYGVFVAETAEDERIIDPDAEDAVVVEHASFTWETAPPAEDTSSKKSKKNRKSKSKSRRSKGKGSATPFDDAHHDAVTEHEIFQIRDLNLRIPRGQLCAIVGPVGSGKSSLLQGLVGEMRKTEGSITLGGTVSYCPQSAWIQNATIRENICFGKPFDSDRYWKAVHDSCLEADFDLLEYGDMTEIGEKGISLSGGQKQRINICRSIYANTDIQIFDDPLSALDAHVGKDVFHNVLKSNSHSHTTRILVTHALHFLPQVDYIITIDDGKIVEQGTYEQLMKNEKGVFAKLMKEFDRDNKSEGDSNSDSEEEDIQAVSASDARRKEAKAPGTALMQTEERAVGTVAGAVYRSYFAAARGQVLVPIFLASLFLMQGANVFSSYWLVYWEERKWPQSQAFYIGIYSALGLTQAIFSFVLGSLFAVQAYFASRELHRASIDRVMHAPTSFFETTPLGRIVNRFSKDVDTVDNFLADAWNSFLNSVGSIGGAVVLISAVFPWFLIPAFILAGCYFYFSLFYRAGTRELNRLNSVLRGTLVSHFSESLSGMSTIRAYGEFARFRKENEKRVDGENEAYWLTVASQRWLSIRLDSLGAALVFVVAMLAVIGRYLISPSQSGIMLSYILSIQSALSLVVKQGAQVEVYMNSVERMVHYAEEIEQEKFKGEEQPPESWPRNGSLEFKDLHLSYRPELPPVLKGLNMRLNSGEKLGIVGRTGAGKSSIMVALFRMVEAKSGSIIVDGVDTSKIDLEVLRSAMSIIPQEAVLFPGTIRSNLDPFGLHDDAVLWDALKRAHLADPKAKETVITDEEHQIVSHIKANRFSLDAPVDDEGGNLSMGERSLISLARALVKKSRILVLDEATASVDYETDRKIQDTIAHEFRDQTILCIAHRINTIIGYDRVCVMDAGRVAELDTPAKLFEQKGIFRSMCDQSGISLEDILLAQKARAMA